MKPNMFWNDPHQNTTHQTQRRPYTKSNNDSTDNEVVFNLSNQRSPQRPVNEAAHALNEANNFEKNLSELHLQTPNKFINPLKTTLGEGLDTNVSPIHVSFEDSEDEQLVAPITPAKPLKDSLIFVDVRAENENRSKAISRELERLGATIADKVTGSVTHIVFKNGRNKTLTQLKKFPNIHFVSVLWVDSCKTTSSHISESLFPAKAPENAESPWPIARSKRVKSLQPKTFEEDLNNSAKKEDRRKRRLKKLNKEPDTPDQIICLDSQEYIRSSDLYKLVATPRAVPDTPWILKYINGTSEDETPLQLDNEDNHPNSENIPPYMQELSQDIQCKLNFDCVDGGEKRESYFIALGSSPTDANNSEFVDGSSSTNTTLQKEELKYSKRTSVCRRRSSRLTSSPLKGTITSNTKQINEPVASKGPLFINNKEVEPLLKKTIVTEKSTCIYPKQQRLVNNIPETVAKSTQDIDSSEQTVLKPGITKKKKKLFSKTQFGIPQDKLISPALKSDESNTKKKAKLLSEQPTKIRQKRFPSQINKSFDVYTAIHSVENSKKENGVKLERKSSSKTLGITEKSSNKICSTDQTFTGYKVSEIPVDQSNQDFKMSIAYDETQRKLSYLSNFTEMSMNQNEKSIQVQTKISHKPDTSYNADVSGKKVVADDKTNSAGQNQEKYAVKGKSTKYDCALKSTSMWCKSTLHDTTVSRRSSGVDFKVAKTFHKAVNNTSIKCIKAKRSEISLSDNNPMSTEMMTKDGELKDYEVISNERKSTAEKKNSIMNENNAKNLDLNSDNITLKTNISNLTVPREFDLVDANPDEEFANLSFIHDENEGLICLSQSEITETKGNLCSSNAILTAIQPLSNEQSKIYLQNENIGCDITSQSSEETNAHLSDRSDNNEDSGISDSEEINGNIDDSQLIGNYSSVETVETTRKTALNQAQQESVKRKSAATGKSRLKESTVKTLPNTTKKKKVMNRTLHQKKAQVEKVLTKKSVKPKVSLVTTSLHFSEQEYARAMVKKLDGFALRINVSHDTTHVIAGGPRRTLNILNAIINGCWILQPKWIADSIEQGEWLDEGNYEMTHEFPAAKISRINRLRTGKSSHFTLFSKLPPIYLAEVTCPSHEEMMKLITSCGAQLTTSIRKAGVGIGMINCRRKDLKIVTEKWILDSISNGRIMPLEQYEIRLKSQRHPSPDY